VIYLIQEINKRTNLKGEINMMKMMVAIEVMAMMGMMVAMKRNRTLAELVMWGGILVVANAVAWQM
jgi:hypothetical protein